MLSALHADGYLTITIALRPFILWVVAVTMFVLATGFLIGNRFGSTRIVFVPERPRGARKYWMQPDGSITAEQSPEGSAEKGLPLNREASGG